MSCSAYNLLKDYNDRLLALLQCILICTRKHVNMPVLSEFDVRPPVRTWFGKTARREHSCKRHYSSILLLSCRTVCRPSVRHVAHHITSLPTSNSSVIFCCEEAAYFVPQNQSELVIWHSNLNFFGEGHHLSSSREMDTLHIPTRSKNDTRDCKIYNNREIYILNNLSQDTHENIWGAHSLFFV